MTGERFRKQRPTLHRAIVESTGGDQKEIEAAIRVVQFARAGLIKPVRQEESKVGKVVLFSIGQVARRVSDQIGQDVDTGWCSRHLKEIDPAEGRGYSPSKRFSGEQSGLLILYAMEWYKRHNAPSFTRWIEDHGHTIPSPFNPPSVTKQQGPKRGGAPVSSAEIEKMVEKTVKRLLKQRSAVAAIDGQQLELNREEDIRPLNKAVISFALKHPIEINETWKSIERLFEQRNGIRVMRSGDQSFPQWLHSSGNMPLMMDQLQGFLDFMHDELVGRAR